MSGDKERKKPHKTVSIKHEDSIWREKKGKSTQDKRKRKFAHLLADTFNERMPKAIKEERDDLMKLTSKKPVLADNVRDEFTKYIEDKIAMATIGITNRQVYIAQKAKTLVEIHSILADQSKKVVEILHNSYKEESKQVEENNEREDEQGKRKATSSPEV